VCLSATKVTKLSDAGAERQEAKGKSKKVKGKSVDESISMNLIKVVAA
jgi:hypothetical protein